MWLADDSLSAQYGPSWPRHHLGWFFQYGKIIALAAHIRISGREHLKRIVLEQPGMQINNRASSFDRALLSHVARVLSYLAAFRIPLKAITPWGGGKKMAIDGRAKVARKFCVKIYDLL